MQNIHKFYDTQEAGTQTDESMQPTFQKEGGGAVAPKKMRSFAEILADAKENRNILVIKLAKKQINVNGVKVNPEHLDYEKIGELLFDIIGLKIEDCERVAWTTNRWDTKEVQLKSHVNAGPFLRPQAFLFNDHYVTVSAMSTRVTEVTFRNVPLCIPDEEIINLCGCYGLPINNEVYCKASAQMRGAVGSTRYVKMQMNPGKQFENFYWLSGPLDTDQGARITITHEGQVSQCSNCLRRANDCTSGGKGKLCKDNKVPRADMKDYMRYLKEDHGFTSLKNKYREDFPLQTDNDGFGHIEDQDLEEQGDQENIEEGAAAMADSAAIIAELQRELSEANAAREQGLHEVARMKAENQKPKKLELGLNHTATGQLNIRADIFSYDEDNDTVEVLDEDLFQNEIESKCLIREEGRAEKLQQIKDRLLSQVRGINRRKNGRRDSISSVRSITSGVGSVRERSPDSSKEENPPAKTQKLSISSLPVLAKK